MSENRLDHAKQAEFEFNRGDFNYAIWLIENSMTHSDECQLRKFAPSVFAIDHMSKAKAIRQAESLILQSNTILDFSDELEQEEWMLIITNLSICYCLNRFLIRVNHEGGVDISQHVERLARVTNGFSMKSFVGQLKEARSRFPNPLPPPID